jgi:predicted ester cyclase
MIGKSGYWQTISAHAVLADGGLQRLATALYAPDVKMHVSAPVGSVTGLGSAFADILTALPDAERRTDILLGGEFASGHWFASTGYIVGHFIRPLWGMQPTGRPLWLRFGWFDRAEGDRICESYIIFDVARAMIEAGQWSLAPQLGQNWSPAPQTQDGISFGSEGAEQSLALVEAMIGGLMRYDRHSLASMRMVDFWHPQFHWYGPGGIGSARGHADYERAHQRPFLTAFPDRVGGNHKCRIGDGTYVASTGWPSINATHSGDGWLGLPATGKRITMKVMDFWRRDGDLLAENWVFIDMIDLLDQIGVDVFARLEALHGNTGA